MPNPPPSSDDDSPASQAGKWWQRGGGDWQSPWDLEPNSPFVASKHRPAPAPRPTPAVRPQPAQPPPPPVVHEAVPPAPAHVPPPVIRPRAVVRPAPAPEPERRPEPVQEEFQIPPPPPRPVRRADPEEYRRDRLRRVPFGDVSWVSAAMIGMAVLSFAFVAWLYIHDQPAGDDEDLVKAGPVDQVLSVPSVERMKQLLDALKPAKPAALAIGPPWVWDMPTLSEFLATNDHSMDNLKDLLEDAEWHGRHAAWYHEDLGSHPNWGIISLMKQAEAAYLVRRGEEEAAFAAALDLAELAARLQEMEAWPSFYSRSLDVHTRSVQLMAHLLGGTRLSGAALGASQQVFAACLLSDKQLKEHLLPAFYLHEKKLLLGRKSGAPLDTLPGGVEFARPGRLFFKTNETLDLFATTFRILRTEVGQVLTGLGNRADLRGSARSVASAGYYQPNGAGEAYFLTHVDPYLDIPAQYLMARTRHLLVMQLFAFRRFAADQKRLPLSPQELVPKYLPELPTDPFSGDLFQYDVKRGLLYSFGSNFANDGGRPSAVPLADDKEPTVNIGFPVAVPVSQ